MEQFKEKKILTIIKNSSFFILIIGIMLLVIYEFLGNEIPYTSYLILYLTFILMNVIYIIFTKKYKYIDELDKYITNKLNDNFNIDELNELSNLLMLNNELVTKNKRLSNLNIRIIERIYTLKNKK